MKNYILSTIIVFAFAGAQAQVKVSQGNSSPGYKAVNQPVFSSFANDNANYFVIRRTENFEKINTLIIAGKTGNIGTATDIRINRGSFNNNSEVNNLLVAGNTIAAFVESRNKSEGKNTLSARIIDNTGNVSSTDIPIGSIDFVKMSNAGTWYTALTPDGKHVAVVGKLPHEKNKPDQFKYFFLDDNLKETGHGEFSFNGTDEIHVWQFRASDKGDLYIIAEAFDQSYKYPVVYEKLTGSASATVIPVIIADPHLRSLSYTTSVNSAGELIIAGYSQQKKSFSMGDVMAVGCWLFNSSKPQEVKADPFTRPVANLTARNIVYNGDTFFLIGEQYKAEKESPTGSAMQQMNMPENYHYEHGDVMVTAFSNDGAKKFDIPLSRKWESRNADVEFMVASGIIGNKLALVYNDQYGKYVDDKYYRNYKLPVAVMINNDGLMDAPVHFENELDVKLSSYTLLPLFFNANSGQMVLLSGNAESVKTVTFQ